MLLHLKVKYNETIFLLLTWLPLVCATTGKRKACKDCSCGLAEELAGETKISAVNSANAKSSCGNVSYLNIDRIYLMYKMLFFPVLFGGCI